MKTPTQHSHTYSHKGSSVEVVIDKRELNGIPYFHLEATVKTPGESDARLSIGILDTPGGTSLGRIVDRDKELIDRVAKVSRLSEAAPRN